VGCDMAAQQITRRANSDGSTTITLAGDLTIESCGTLKQILSEAMDETPQIILNLKNLESIDLTCLQLICSACKTANAMGRGFECEGNTLPEAVSCFGKSLGAPQGLPCGDNSNKPCIWYGGVN